MQHDAIAKFIWMVKNFQTYFKNISKFTTFKIFLCILYEQILISIHFSLHVSTIKFHNQLKTDMPSICYFINNK